MMWLRFLSFGGKQPDSSRYQRHSYSCPKSVMSYNNAVRTVTNSSTPDPWVIRGPDCFYFTFTAGNRVEIWSSRSFFDFESGTKVVAWRPSPGAVQLANIWAPELHAFNGRWYIYVAAELPGEGNKSHRMYVIRGPASSQSPLNGPWECLGPIRGLPQSQWQIDGTVAWLNQTPYFVYSGWPLGRPGYSELVQELYIARMAGPTEVSSQPVRISAPEYDWEKSGNHCINEGPQFLSSPDGTWIGLVYSCGASWNQDYKMVPLRWTGEDPLSPSSWQKSQRPLLRTAPHGRGPFGPGHGSFIPMGDETICVYHAIDDLAIGWESRRARIQRLVFRDKAPYMGEYIGREVGSVSDFTYGQRLSRNDKLVSRNCVNIGSLLKFATAQLGRYLS